MAETLRAVDYFSPVTIISWILAQPIRLFGYIVKKVRVYNPEKDVCPACGFKGDSGTGGKSCLVSCVKTTGPEKAALQHICFRCTAQFHTPIVVKAEKWLK